MNREEMLKKLGLSSEELDDFVRKYHHFLGTLDPAQRDMITRSLPTVDQAMKAFGPELKADELIKLFHGSKQIPIVACMFPLASTPTE